MIKNRIQYVARLAGHLPFDLLGTEALEKAFCEVARKFKVPASTALLILDRHYCATVETADDPRWRPDILARRVKHISSEHKHVAAVQGPGGAKWENQRFSRSTLLLDALVVIKATTGSCPEAVIDEIAGKLKVPQSVVSLVKSLAISAELTMTPAVYLQIKGLVPQTTRPKKGVGPAKKRKSPVVRANGGGEQKLVNGRLKPRVAPDGK